MPPADEMDGDRCALPLPAAPAALPAPKGPASDPQLLKGKVVRKKFGRRAGISKAKSRATPRSMATALSTRMDIWRRCGARTLCRCCCRRRKECGRAWGADL
eukprot:4497138-Prymnesium_polylepis.1